MDYRIGLDIGIGSVGWAVISGKRDESRIEDFGVRIFDSGEKENGKSRKSQERRSYRGTRRLIRRRKHRKVILTNHLINIGFLRPDFIEKAEEIKNKDVYEIKVRGLDEKLTEEELYKCIIHFCNHRGYKDFYEDDKQHDKESGINKEAARLFDFEFEKSGYRTVSEYLINEKKNGGFVKYRNTDSQKADDYRLIHRHLLREELEQIIKKQSQYYPSLNGEAGRLISEYVFRQRIFEDGPGNANDEHRRYTGFLEMLGQCPFYPNEKRGFRCTVISDVYAVINVLSQYTYVNMKNGEVGFNKIIAEAVIAFLLREGSISFSNVKTISKDFGYKVLKGQNLEDNSIAKSIKFIRPIKKAVEESGEDWLSFMVENHFDTKNPSRLNRIGEVISMYQTPSKRLCELKKIEGLSDQLIKRISSKKFSGTSSTSNKYMLEAIEAFRNGEIYGNFQANFNNNVKEGNQENKTKKLSISQIEDDEIKNNPVVFRAINETRKILNNIIEIYGSPSCIAVEVASDLNRSFDLRMKIQKEQRQREKKRDDIKKKIAEILCIEEDEVKESQIERYKLYEEQEGKCLYSGKPFGDIKDVLQDKNHACEIDHIVPYSLILDNTINNKALVLGFENQAKGQRVPLMYLVGSKKDAYKERVNGLYLKNGKIINEVKYKYLMMETLYSTDAEQILSAWKSRNINDTRYITKYIIALIEKNLMFATDSGRHVFGIKGANTSKFRKIWLEDTKWGTEEKNRDTYLNHAIDAIIVANLTPEYLEIASDSRKLMQIKRISRKGSFAEYEEYIEECCKKMKKYYGFSESYTRHLLQNSKRIPAYLPKIKEEVEARFIDDNKETFNNAIKNVYENLDSFIVQPHMPIVSCKSEKRYRGAIADSNPIRVEVVNGVPCKIKKIDVSTLNKGKFGRLYTSDKDLAETLERIFDGKDDSYTVGKYLVDNGLSKFKTDKGTFIFKVSLNEGAVSNYYKICDKNSGYTTLGMLKYYCIELYRNDKGDLLTRGVRYVDIIHKDGKLYMKKDMLPSDYKEHEMYLFKNDYITILNKEGKTKYEGYYKSVKSIQRSCFYFSSGVNSSETTEISITKKDSVIKKEITILGHEKGIKKCSEPLSLM